MAESLDTILQQLETAGITFAHIPAGEYTVGYNGNAPLLAKPPGVAFIEPTATPLTKITTDGFYITHDLLRWSQWRTLIDQPAYSLLFDFLPEQVLSAVLINQNLGTTAIVEPSAGQVQFKGERPDPILMDSQPNPDPPLPVTAELAQQIASKLGASLPRWYEWEIATRGLESWLYPWGNGIDLDALSLEYQDYSMEDSGTMGYYSYDQELYFVHSYGPYINKPSPFGLLGLARPGQEWNQTHDSLPEEVEYILRSLSDLGGMTMMIPGIRPNSWPFGGWKSTHRELAFSGPTLPCYAPPNVGSHYHYNKPIFETAAFRLVLRV